VEPWTSFVGDTSFAYLAELPSGASIRVLGFGDARTGQRFQFTSTVGTDLEQTQRLAVIETAFAGWNTISLAETSIGDSTLAQVLARLRPATIHDMPPKKRYRSAARELVDLLAPLIGIPTLAAMCGVSDRGFRNWLEGGGIRLKKSRRLMVIRALVRALVLQKGRDRAVQWLQVPHPEFEMRPPIDLICDGEVARVFELAVNAQPRARRSSIIPEVDSVEGEPTAQSDLAERGELPPPEIYELL
jgi:hypothetical protein